jgi:hypothetical protein
MDALFVVEVQPNVREPVRFFFGVLKGRDSKQPQHGDRANDRQTAAWAGNFSREPDLASRSGNSALIAYPSVPKIAADFDARDLPG